MIIHIPLPFPATRGYARPDTPSRPAWPGSRATSCYSRDVHVQWQVQVVTGSAAVAHLEVLEIHSYIRGYHAYMNVWNPVVGQTLLVKREPTNSKDKNRGAGYGLEVPCVYRLYGPKVYVKRMTEELSARNLTSLAS